MKMFFLITLFLLLIHPVVVAQTALIATVEPVASKQLVQGVQALYESLAALNWKVETLSGVKPTSTPQAGLEFFAAVSNDNLDRYMQDFSIPSYEVSSLPASYSFIVDKTNSKNRIFIVGSDWTGVMYGLLDAANRFAFQSPTSPSGFTLKDEKHSPSLPIRGAAIYLHTQALSDQFSWFHDDSYWDGFLRQLAANRFNYLELRGAFNAVTAEMENLFPFLIPAQTYNNNISDFIKEKNIQRLKKLTDLASEYGIQVSFVNYKASLLDAASQQEISDQANAQFTANAIQVILQQCPNLSGMGFQTGESGKAESFYRSIFIPALTSSSRTPVLTVHPWLSDEFQIRMMMNEYEGDSNLVFKFNGDHLVHPYPVSGNRMSEWHSYSYESYFSNPRTYRAIFQINVRGTNRVFPWMDIEFIRKSMQACIQFGAEGMVIECPSPYTPPYETFLHSVQQENEVVDWHYQRDWFWYEAWGKLAYEPKRNQEEFLQSFRSRFGSQPGAQMLDALQKSSRVIPAFASVHYPAPDVRSFSPELEPPLSIFKWMDAQPLDMLTIRSVQEEIDSRISRSVDAKRSPLQVLLDAEKTAQDAAQLSKQAGEALQQLIEQGQVENTKRSYREWLYLDTNIQALAALNRYLRTSLECALQFGMFQQSGDTPSLLIASETTKGLMMPWTEFQQHMQKLYSPIHDAIRTKNPYFHWLNLTPTVEEDRQQMEQAYTAWQEGASWQQHLGHNRAFIASSQQSFILTCSIPPGRNVTRLNVRFKNSFGQTGNVPMMPSTVEGIYAVEIDGGNMTDGAFEYFILGEIDGTTYKVPPDTDGAFYTVSVTPDHDPPSVLDTEHQFSVSHDRLAVIGNFFDPSGIISARLFWKQLPSDAVWNDIPLNLSGNDFIANFPITPDGTMYAIEIIDGVGNGIRIPDVTQGVPYFLIPAFGADSADTLINEPTSPVQPAGN